MNNPAVVETVVILSLADIDFDWNWNCRLPLRDATGRVVGCSGSAGQDIKGDTEFGDLKASLAADGQKQAVLVRPHPKAKKSGKKYHLVAGYQRTEALAQLAAEEPNKYKPEVRAIVREMTEEEARVENLRENTARSALSGPDLTVGIQKLLKENPNLTDVAIAARLGKSQGYINKLVNIMKAAKSEELLEKWRTSPVTVPVMKMATIAELDTADEQLRQFEASQKKEKSNDSTPTRGPDAWTSTAKDKARTVGHALGVAAGHGSLVISDHGTFFSDYLRTFVEFKAAPKDDDKLAKYHEQVASIVEAFQDGYAKGFDAANAPAKAAE